MGFVFYNAYNFLYFILNDLKFAIFRKLYRNNTNFKANANGLCTSHRFEGSELYCSAYKLLLLAGFCSFDENMKCWLLCLFPLCSD